MTDNKRYPAPKLTVGGKYNWKNQPERLVYLGLCEPRNGRWHQFAKVESPAEVWCEVQDADLHMIEETPTDATCAIRAGEPSINTQDLIDWVAERWHDEVANRPMINVHRRSLDDTWRQVLRHLGVDDRVRLGPTHDDLRAEISSTEWAKMMGETPQPAAPQVDEGLEAAWKEWNSRRGIGVWPDKSLFEAGYRTSRAVHQAASFQARVRPWLLECFGEMIAGDREERNHRFLEESLELVQSLGCTASEAHQLVDYVFGRPVGEPKQEAGGVMVTLAALCLANGLDMHEAGEAELERISQPGMIAKIAAKQAAKPKHSPLPEAPAVVQAAPAAVAGPLDQTWCRYVAGLICTYLQEDMVGEKAKAIAGIIERRLVFLAAPITQAAPQPAAPQVKYVPVDSRLRDGNWQHPNDDEPRTEACRAALRERGDDDGQGLDGYWKWGFAAGFNAALTTQPQEAAPPRAYSGRERGAWEDGYAAGKASAQPQEAAPAGFVLVPKRLNAEMRRVMDTEDWTWEDLLAAAEAITEQEYAELAAPSQDAEDAARLDWLQETSCDLRSVDMPTGAGDFDVHWIVVEHYMAEPHEREIGRSFSDDPRAAIDAARAQAKEGGK